MKLYANHPLSEVFPKLPPDEVRQLVQSIKDNGLQKAITIYEGKILDGRHRYEACNMADVRPVFEFYKGADPLGYVMVANLHRRHLDSGQRAMIAAKIATMRQGERTDLEPFRNSEKVSLKTAAESLSVSVDSVVKAGKILEESPKLAKQVLNGDISLNAAGQKIKHKRIPKSEQAVVDKKGLEIPTEVIPLWNRSQEVQDVLTMISRAKCVLEKAKQDGDMLFRGLSWQRGKESLDAAYEAVSQFLPYVVCVSCNGRISIQCTMCQGRGLISEDVWKSKLAQEIAAIRAKQVKP
jgi:hypothetical protein